MFSSLAVPAFVNTPFCPVNVAIDIPAFIEQVKLGNIEQAYKINIKQQIRDIIDGIIFSKEQIQVLLKTDNLLEKLYDKYEKSDGNIWEYLEDNVGDSLGNIVKEYNQLKNKNKEKER